LGSSAATAAAKAAAESHLGSLETAYDASKYALMGKYYELRDLESLAGEATDPAHRAASLNRAGDVEREIVETYSPNELNGFDELEGNTNAFHLAKAVSGLSAVDDLRKSDRHIAELNASGQHEEAWAETLGEALKFPAEVITLIPNKLGIAANFGLDIGLPQAADALGKELGHLTYEPIRRFVQGDPGTAANPSSAAQDFPCLQPPDRFGLDPSVLNERSPFDEIENRLGIDPSVPSGTTLDDIENRLGIDSSAPSGTTLDDIENRLDSMGAASSSSGASADGLAGLDAPASDGTGFEEF
jgi:hypothetical protein